MNSARHHVLALLRSFGILISKRQLVRLLIAGQGGGRRQPSCDDTSRKLVSLGRIEAADETGKEHANHYGSFVGFLQG
jgi:hypothetical protein